MGSSNNNIYVPPEARDAYDLLMAGENLNGTDPKSWGSYGDLIQSLNQQPEEDRRSYLIDQVNGPDGKRWQILASAEPKTIRYILHWASEALTQSVEIDWVVTDMISKGSVNLIVGDAGCGKTYLMLALAVIVTMGQAFLGYAVKQCPVLLIDEESGPRRLGQRLGDTMRGYGVESNIPLAYLTLERLDLGKPDDIQAIIEAIEETGAGLVIIDALADVMPGCNENDVKDIQPIFMALRNIAEETQVAIIVIHHANKNGDYRGSTAMKAAVDLMLKVTKTGDVVSVKSEKARDVEQVTFAAKFNFEPDSFSLSQTVAPKGKSTFSKSQL